MAAQGRVAEGLHEKYNVEKLVYAEEYADINEAIHREKCIKEWKRDWKIELIEKSNPTWQDLFVDESHQIPAFAGMTDKNEG